MAWFAWLHLLLDGCTLFLAAAIQVINLNRVLYKHAAAGSGSGRVLNFGLSGRVLKGSFAQVERKAGGMFLPSPSWAPLGAHEASETEVLLTSLLLLVAFEGNPQVRNQHKNLHHLGSRACSIVCFELVVM